MQAYRRGLRPRDATLCRREHQISLLKPVLALRPSKRARLNGIGRLDFALSREKQRRVAA